MRCLTLKTAIIATGSELVGGLVQDINSKFLAKSLNDLGFENKKIYVCDDDKKEIKNAIIETIKNVDLIFITGGLGPTKDDQTKEAFAEALNLKMIYAKKIETSLKNIFVNCESEMTNNNLSQAYLPLGAEIIENKKGTAPGLKVEYKNKRFYLLPGVPSELKYIFTNEILSEIKKISEKKAIIKEFNFIGLGESKLAAEIKKLNLNSNLKISYQAGKAEVKLRIKINPDSIKENEAGKKIIKKATAKIRKKFHNFIYGEDQQGILDRVHQLLVSQNLTIAAAESFSGGLISERLTKKAGSSKYFLGSVVAYNEQVKKELLNIEQSIFKKYGVVSRECVKAMALNTADIFSSDIAIATTGAAGPTSHNGHQAGTMFIGIFYQGEVDILKINKNYGREMNRFYASQIILFELYKLLKESEEKND